MLAGIVLIAIATLYRLLPILLGYTTQQPDWMPNFSPLAALCLCGAAFLPRRIAIALPLTSLLVSSVLLNAHYGWSSWNPHFLGQILSFAAIAGLGWILRPQATAKVILPGTFGASLFFYIVTNTVSWIYDPFYSKSLLGWQQALWTGVEGYPSTWQFFRNSLVSDMVFAVLFLLCVRGIKFQRSSAPIPAAQW